MFQSGHIVRVLKQNLTFETGCEKNRTEELFLVTECVPRDPPVYRIKDLMDKPIKGTFYPQEPQRVQLKEIEEILGKGLRNGRVEYHVKFKRYPTEFNQWIASSDFFP